LERPTPLTDWLSFTPLAGARLTHYENQEFDPDVFNTLGVSTDTVTASSGPVDDSYTRDLYELGFDLEARAYATYSTINRTWDVNGLRHLLRPVLRYRYISDPGSENEIAPIDRAAFNLNRPLLNLSDLRNVDTISETHLARLGVENLFQTRAKDYGSRTLATLNFYQDILFERGTRYDGDDQKAFHATWVEFVLTPAPWLKFDIASRFKTESAKLEELRSRTVISSGEIWEIGLSSDFLRDRIDQFRIDFMCRVNERISLITESSYDLETEQFTRTEIALATKLNNTWTIIYAVVFRQDSVREDDVQFSVRFNLADL
jgi:LPS-assembly protein